MQGDITVRDKEIVRIDPLFQGQPRFCCGEYVRLKDGRTAVYFARAVGQEGISIVRPAELPDEVRERVEQGGKEG